MTALADWEMQYRGLVFGGDRDVAVRRVSGLYGYTARADDPAQPRGDGAIPKHHYLEARSVELELELLGSDVELRDMERQVREAFALSRIAELPLWFKLPGDDERLIYCRPTASSWDATHDRRAVIEPTVALTASDPRVYGAERTVSVPLYAADAGGVDDPVDGGAKDVGTIGEQQEAVFHNAGDSDAHPMVQAWGPETGTTTRVTLENRTNGSVLDVETDVLPGQQLVARMREWVTRDPTARPVELDGASRYAAWLTRGEPFWLSPGDNVLRLTVEGAAPTDVQVTARDTYDGTVRS